MRTVDELRTALDYRDAPVTPPAGALIARAHRRRVVRRRTLLAAGTAAVAAPAVAFGLAPVRGGGARPAAAQVLDRAAGVAAGGPEPARGGTVWFTETGYEELRLTTPETGGRAFLTAQRFTTRVWLALPDRQRYDQEAAPPAVTESDLAAWVAARRPPLTGPATVTDDPGTKDTWQLLLDDELGGTSADLRREAELLGRLPTGPAALAAWLRRRLTDDSAGRSLVQWCPIDAGSCGVDAKLFHAAAALLAAPLAEPALRSGLFRVLARLPGVRLGGTTTDGATTDGATTDGAGRRATVVSVMMGQLRHELFFDPDRAMLLGTRQVLVTTPADPDDPQWTGAVAGTAVRSVLYLRSRTVSAIGATA